MKISKVSKAPNFPTFQSRYDIGDVVDFCPVPGKKGEPALVTGIKFVPGKVLYSLKLISDDGTTNFYPLENVDSIYVAP